MTLLPLLLTAVVLAGQVPSPAPPANFTGVWVMEGFFGRGPLGMRNFRAICDLPAEKALADGDQLQSIGNLEGELRISQSPAQVTVERKYSGSLGGGTMKDVLKLDGSESANTSGNIRNTSRTRWDGASLVADHQLRWSAESKDVGCNLRETYTLEGPNRLKLVAVNNEADGPKTSTQTYVRK